MIDYRSRGQKLKCSVFKEASKIYYWLYCNNRVTEPLTPENCIMLDEYERKRKFIKKTDFRTGKPATVIIVVTTIADIQQQLKIWKVQQNMVRIIAS